LASTGYDPYNGVAPSVYATLDGEYLNVPLWFMVDGTVTVKHVDGQLSIEVNALNSYDQEIHIVYNGAGTTDVENTQAAVNGVRKQIRNGQLIIVRDGKAFNAQGAILK
jgi:hypothetical protein